MKRAVRVKIGALAVEGLPVSQAAEFRRALEQELRRLARAEGQGICAPASGKAAMLARRAAAGIGARLPREARRP